MMETHDDIERVVGTKDDSKNYGDGCDLHATMPKTEEGIREIAKLDEVQVM
ncbi:hypothetical protein H6B07_17385 [Mediterraneibacter glycyrrhizinilyticus]|uniref:hypothetical protein n=1 Tax=Mediterraneibacter glycyrrhizinilyticus TaxID=342942 RepID=UPI001961C01E|nr:hypothetical protein [Mediterraneibacter glycyrrhizinilyticus]MBM6804384.1 hypothetical protein [Mediterraneibacter glycyrrhizinilyticus]MDM8126749.1 hypothetical protein [Mediterraneibacter glycyrrhizinilyticus]